MYARFSLSVWHAQRAGIETAYYVSRYIDSLHKNAWDINALSQSTHQRSLIPQIIKKLNMWTADYRYSSVPSWVGLYHREGCQSRLAQVPHHPLHKQSAILSASNSLEKFQPFNNLRWIVPKECQMTGHQQAAPHHHYDPSYIISRSQHYARWRVRTREMHPATHVVQLDVVIAPDLQYEYLGLNQG